MSVFLENTSNFRLYSTDVLPPGLPVRTLQELEKFDEKLREDSDTYDGDIVLKLVCSPKNKFSNIFVPVSLFFSFFFPFFFLVIGGISTKFRSKISRMRKIVIAIIFVYDEVPR